MVEYIQLGCWKLYTSVLCFSSPANWLIPVAIDYRYFDQYSLKELPVDHIWNRFNEASFGDKLMRMNYDIHVGAILGLPGKFFAFFVSLVVASLPVTGFLIWYGRKKKNKHKKQRKEMVTA
jgi:uncharacterized iron-regulated membrane protein